MLTMSCRRQHNFCSRNHLFLFTFVGVCVCVCVCVVRVCVCAGSPCTICPLGDIVYQSSFTEAELVGISRLEAVQSPDCVLRLRNTHTHTDTHTHTHRHTHTQTETSLSKETAEDNRRSSVVDTLLAPVTARSRWAPRRFSSRTETHSLSPVKHNPLSAQRKRH